MEPSYIAEGNENDAVSLENNLSVHEKIKQLPYDPAILLLGMCPKVLKTCLPKKLYTDAQSSIICNSQKVKTI